MRTDGLIRAVSRSITSNELKQIDFGLSGKPTHLSASYLFQAMKTRAQANLAVTEEEVIAPLLIDTLEELRQGVKGDKAKRFVDASLALAKGEEGNDLARLVREDPDSRPRAHYDETPTLRNLYSSMWLLSRGMFDVSLNRGNVSQAGKDYLVFPFKTAKRISKAISKDDGLREKWTDLHKFYSLLTGTADSPTIADLIADDHKISPRKAQAIADKYGIPKINSDFGLAVQAFGERVVGHQLVLNRLAERFIPRTTFDFREAKQATLDALDIKNVLHGKGDVKGLLGRIEAMDPNSFYTLALKAIGGIEITGSPSQQRFRENAVAASLASLAEATSLFTKQSYHLVMYASCTYSGTLSVDQAGDAFFENMAEAARVSYAFGMELAKKYGHTIELHDSEAAIRELGQLAHDGQTMSRSEWKESPVSGFAGTLVRKPDVTVDVHKTRYQKQDQTNSDVYLQWGVGQVETFLHKPDQEYFHGVHCLEMFFFQGLNIDFKRDSEGPLTNTEWREAFKRMSRYDLERRMRPTRVYNTTEVSQQTPISQPYEVTGAADRGTKNLLEQSAFFREP